MEQSDQGKQFYKRLNLFFSKEVVFCPPCQIKQWAFVQWDIVKWAFVLVGFCPSGLLSVPQGKNPLNIFSGSKRPMMLGLGM